MLDKIDKVNLLLRSADMPMHCDIDPPRRCRTDRVCSSRSPQYLLAFWRCERDTLAFRSRRSAPTHAQGVACGPRCRVAWTTVRGQRVVGGMNSIERITFAPLVFTAGSRNDAPYDVIALQEVTHGLFVAPTRLRRPACRPMSRCPARRRRGRARTASTSISGHQRAMRTTGYP